MNIYEKLGVIQQKLKAPKDQTNKFGGYQYRTAENILEALKPLLAETKTTLTISDMIEFVEGRHYVLATATLTDTEKPGDRVVNTAYAREAEEKKGADASQITGAASSYARKYCLCGLFCIDSMPPDADRWNAGDGQPEQKAKKKAAQEKTTGESATLTYIKSMFAKYAYRDFGAQVLDHYGVDALDKMTPGQLAMAAKQAEAYDAAHKDEKEAQA